MSELEQYYNEEIKGNEDTAFSELTEDQARRIYHSLGFALYNLHNAGQRLSEAMCLEGEKTLNQMREGFRGAMKKIIVIRQEWKHPQK